MPLHLIPSHIMDQRLKSHWDLPGVETRRRETAHLASQMDESSPWVLLWLEVSIHHDAPAPQGEDGVAQGTPRVRRA